MKKRIIALLLVFCISVPLVACSTTSKEDEKKVACIVFQDDEFMNLITNTTIETCDAAGVEVMTTNCNKEQAAEIEAIRTYTSAGVKGILIAPLSKDASIAALEEAAKEGVKIVTINMALNDADFIEGGFCSDDHVNGKAVGEFAAQYIKANYERSVKFALIHYDDSLPEQSQARYGGFFEALDEAGVKYEIVASGAAASPDLGLTVMSDMLTANSDLDFVFCSNGGSLSGAPLAIEQAGSDVKVFGYDVDDLISGWIAQENPIVLASVSQDIETMCQKSSDLLLDVIENGSNDMKGKTEIVPGVVLKFDDPEAIAEWRVMKGYAEK